MNAASTAASPGVMGRRTISPRRDAQAMEATRPTSAWLTCVGVVAVGPDLLVSGVLWLLALAVLPGVVACICATLGVVLLVTMAVWKPALGARVLLGARVATTMERDALQSALVRIADAALTQAPHVEVLVWRGRGARARPAIALRSGTGSVSRVLVVPADLAQAATTGMSTAEVSTLMAHAMGRREVADTLVCRCVVAHAAWCLPGRLLAMGAGHMPAPLTAAVRHAVSVGGPLAMLAMAHDLSDGGPGPCFALAVLITAHCGRPAARRSWNAHVEKGGANMVGVLHRRLTPDERRRRRQPSPVTTRRAHLRLVPTEPPN